MKILRAKSQIVSKWDLECFFRKKGIGTGDRFGVSWKVGKRRKLKSYEISFFHYPIGDDADYGDSTDITIWKNNGKHQIEFEMSMNQFVLQGN